MECSVTTGTFIPQLLPGAQGPSQERGWKNVHDRSAAVSKSRQLRLSAQIRASQHSSMEWKGEVRSHPA